MQPVQPAHELLQPDLSGEERRQAAVVGVEPGRNGERRQAGMCVEQARDHARPAVRDAADEDDLGVLGQRQALGCGARVRSYERRSTVAQW